jgi:hypothetical protein
MKAKLLALFVMTAALLTTACVGSAGYGGGYYRQGYSRGYYRQGYGADYRYRHDRHKKRDWERRERYYDRRRYGY